jgi:DNA polymerase-3 subunit delta
MGEKVPVIYIFHGEDEFAIAQHIAGLREKQADPAGLNFTTLDGRSLSFEELVTATNAMPFLAARRLVVLTNPLAYINQEPARQQFLDYLETIPATTGLVLVENRPLTDKDLRKKNQTHWLEKWARQAGERVFINEFRLPSGSDMLVWMRDRARQLGGEISPTAASLLASLVGEDARLLDQEMQKLLVYVNFQRSVQPDDVQLLTASYGEGDIFELVDALGNRNGRKAMAMSHRLLSHQDALSIFGMVVRQFRMLLISREILDNGGGEAEIIHALKEIKYNIPAFVARRLVAQTRYFNLPDLEAIYHRLLSIDIAAKSSEVGPDLSLDLLVADLMT